MKTNKKSILDLMEKYNYPKTGKYLLQDMYCFRDLEEFYKEYKDKINLEEYSLVEGDLRKISNICKYLSDSLFGFFNPKPLEEKVKEVADNQIENSNITYLSTEEIEQVTKNMTLTR